MVKDLKAYVRNPRKNDKAVDAVAASIKEFGFRVPIVIDANNEIIAGHTRLKAAKKLGLTEVPCIRADDLTPAQVKAYRLADNKTAELAEWDLGALDIELAGLDLDMTAFGFDIDDDNCPSLKQVELKAYQKVHYLISADINLNDTILEHISRIKEIEGVEVESTCN
jgi:ParB-like chromosome segregation protein Spo0J